MAELKAPASPAWTRERSRIQLSTVAWLRWRIFVNSLRRKGGAGELIGCLLLYGLLLGFFLFPTLGAGAGAFYIFQYGQIVRLAWLLWGTFLLAQLLNINLGQPGTTFDPNELIRFPMQLPQFVLLRLSFSLLTPGSVLPVLMCFSMALGVSLAAPALATYAFVAMAVFALVNVLFNRMLFAWVDRWLSTRRAREVFTTLLFVGSLGFQYVNVKVNLSGREAGTAHARSKFATGLVHAYQHTEPALALLPPGLTAKSLGQALAGHRLSFLLLTAACCLYGAVFLTVFALRMRVEFRGEALGDVAQGGAAQRISSTGTKLPSSGAIQTTTQPRSQTGFPLGFSPVVRAVMRKELMYSRRNTGLFYGLLGPLVMVFLFAGRMTTRGSTPWIFPAALAYVLLGVMPLSYNSFGLEGAGAQLYFMAPVRFRDVVLAKNLMGFCLAAFEAIAVVCVIGWGAGRPALVVLVSCLLWMAATLLFGATLGNRRSLSAPKRINLARTAGKQASPLSALMSMGVLLLMAALGACFLFISRRFALPWLPLLAFAMLLAGALAVYTRGLRAVERFALDHREPLFEELCKA